MERWKHKAHRLIHNACTIEYLSANTTKAGKKYWKHIPYIVPEIAENLIDFLNTDNEERAKAIFLGYDGMKLMGN